MRVRVHGGRSSVGESAGLWSRRSGVRFPSVTPISADRREPLTCETSQERQRHWAVVSVRATDLADTLSPTAMGLAENRGASAADGSYLGDLGGADAVR